MLRSFFMCRVAARLFQGLLLSAFFSLSSLFTGRRRGAPASPHSPALRRWRAAGDNPAWRAFAPQWTSEAGAHRVWKQKLGQRSGLLKAFNAAVAAGSEKPPELDSGKI